MPLLLDSDYVELEERGISFVEDEPRRLLILKDFELPQSVYRQERCDVLIVVPANYNQTGNDMLWTFPMLEMASGAPIPATCGPESDSRAFDNKVFCRWSRHWHSGAGVWKPGVDNVTTILNRITWAFNHPSAQ